MMNFIKATEKFNTFEEYVAGVAYAEVGPSANMEVLKAQMVAARSFALAPSTAAFPAS